MVARFRSSLRPIHRIKHVVDIQTAVPVNTALPQVLINTVDAPTLGSPIEVQTGCSVNGIFVTVEGVLDGSASGKTPNFYLIFYKNPGANLTLPNGNAVGPDDNKRYVFHQEMVMMQGNSTDDGVPRNLFKGVLAIPRGFRRMANSDQIVVQLFIPSTGVAANVCIQCHYKEFR